jgi:hypothetical protein
MCLGHEGKAAGGGGLALTTHPHLAPRLRKSRAIPVLILWVFVACSRAKPFNSRTRRTSGQRLGNFKQSICLLDILEHRVENNVALFLLLLLQDCSNKCFLFCVKQHIPWLTAAVHWTKYHSCQLAVYTVTTQLPTVTGTQTQSYPYLTPPSAIRSSPCNDGFMLPVELQCPRSCRHPRLTAHTDSGIAQFSLRCCLLLLGRSVTDEFQKIYWRK